jgi:enamine deaminase RidA (YjgF/YER057c/UK114 family)
MRGIPIVPGVWADFYEQTKIPAAVLAGDTLYVTGHTGTLDDGTFPSGDEEQIRQTFRNITATLSEAQASWDDVVEITTYHVDMAAQGDLVLEVAAEFISAPYPAWTAVGIAGLYEPEAVVEISCVAVIG